MLVAYWPIAVGLAVLVIAAWLNHHSGRVPNVLTLGMIAAAWMAAWFIIGLVLVPTAGGSLASSVACTFAALAALLPAYIIGFVPAGCVKAQMAFGAWLGCAIATGPAFAGTVIATIAGILLTAFAMALYRRQERAKIDEDYDFGVSRPAELFPIQTTLSAGSLCGFAAAIVFGFIV
jgi:hypothetical protein